MERYDVFEKNLNKCADGMVGYKDITIFCFAAIQKKGMDSSAEDLNTNYLNLNGVTPAKVFKTVFLLWMTFTVTFR